MTGDQQAELPAEGTPRGRGQEEKGGGIVGGISRVGGVGRSQTREGKGVWAAEGASCLKTRSLVGGGG